MTLAVDPDWASTGRAIAPSVMARAARRPKNLFMLSLRAPVKTGKML
jgi:hypothetical protein